VFERVIRRRRFVSVEERLYVGDSTSSMFGWAAVAVVEVADRPRVLLCV
jgi:hypothetical protein